MNRLRVFFFLLLVNAALLFLSLHNRTINTKKGRDNKFCVQNEMIHTNEKYDIVRVKAHCVRFYRHPTITNCFFSSFSFMNGTNFLFGKLTYPPLSPFAHDKRRPPGTLAIGKGSFMKNAIERTHRIL